MIERIETYKEFDIDKVQDAPINNILKSEIVYHGCKLDFFTAIQLRWDLEEINWRSKGRNRILWQAPQVKIKAETLH